MANIITKLNELGGSSVTPQPPFITLTNLPINKTFKIIGVEKRLQREGALYTSVVLDLQDDDEIFRTNLPTRVTEYLISNPEKYLEFIESVKYFQYKGLKTTRNNCPMAEVCFTA